MSGLTVGYLSIDELILELRVIGGTEEEKKNGKIIQEILSSKHRLLVTLLVSNAFAMEALPIFLNKLVPEWAAILVSTTLVLFIGEVIPQALCTGPNQMQIAAGAAPMTKMLIKFLYPVNEPLGALLDKLLGVHGHNRLANTDLRVLIELHTYSALKKLNLLHNESLAADKQSNKKLQEFSEVNHSSSLNDLSPCGNSMASVNIMQDDFGLNDEQANMMVSAIEMKDKKAIEVMIPIFKTFMFSYDDPIDYARLNVMIERGYSRIPVYSGSNTSDLIGLVRIKQLIGLDLSVKKSMRQHRICLNKPLVIAPKLNLLDLLKEFKKGKSHMAFITEQVAELQKKLGLNRSNSIQGIKCSDNSDVIKGKEIKVLGIVTLEDVIEKLINIEIYDEDDYEDQNRKLPVNQSAVLKSKNPYY